MECECSTLPLDIFSTHVMTKTEKLIPMSCLQVSWQTLLRDPLGWCASCGIRCIHWWLFPRRTQKPVHQAWLRSFGSVPFSWWRWWFCCWGIACHVSKDDRQFHNRYWALQPHKASVPTLVQVSTWCPNRSLFEGTCAAKVLQLPFFPYPCRIDSSQHFPILTSLHLSCKIESQLTSDSIPIRWQFQNSYLNSWWQKVRRACLVEKQGWSYQRLSVQLWMERGWICNQLWRWPFQILQ